MTWLHLSAEDADRINIIARSLETSFAEPDMELSNLALKLFTDLQKHGYALEHEKSLRRSLQQNILELWVIAIGTAAIDFAMLYFCLAVLH